MFPCLKCGAEWPSQWAATECEICLPYPCPICGTRFASKTAADDRCCPVCGSKRRKPADLARTALTSYAQYECAKCGSFYRANFVKGRVTTRISR